MSQSRSDTFRYERLLSRKSVHNPHFSLPFLPLIHEKLKVKVTLQQATKNQRWSRSLAVLFLQPRCLIGLVFNPTPRPLYPWERLGTLCIGGWVGPRAGLNGWGKSRPPRGSDPRTIQPVAIRYSPCATQAPHDQRFCL